MRFRANDTKERLWPICILAAGIFLLATASTAVALPPYEGHWGFGQIASPGDPEEYSREVLLGEGQELKLIDETSAAVYYGDGVHIAFHISAGAAHDAVGSNVPTSLNVSGENIVTLTVHHRAGNPATGGIPFDYPIVAGEGWEGGFMTHKVLMPPDEAQLRQERERREAEERERREALEGCRVPRLKGRTLRAAARRLANAGCVLGQVRGKRSKEARVVKQDLETGAILPSNSAVSVKLG